jgi:hypothetical protein
MPDHKFGAGESLKFDPSAFYQRMSAKGESHRKGRQVLAEDEDQVVRTVALAVLFAGDRLDALAVANKSVGQAGIFPVMSAPIPQSLMADLAEDVAGTVSHPEIDTFEPGELEVLLIPDQRHEQLLSFRRACSDCRGNGVHMFVMFGLYITAVV